MESVAYSVNKIPIRLTPERWMHIVENHDDLAGYFYDILEAIERPTWIFEGDDKELWAVKMISSRKALLVIYRENSEKKDGFIITAFFTSKIQKLLKRRLKWQQQQ